MPGIAHIMLNVSDFLQSEAFYDRLLFRLGFSENFRDEATDVAVKSYILNEHNIWIRSDRATEHQPFVRDVGLDHIALSARSKSEVDEVYEALRKANASSPASPDRIPNTRRITMPFIFATRMGCRWRW